jgi:hypothetical protein
MEKIKSCLIAQGCAMMIFQEKAFKFHSQHHCEQLIFTSFSLECVVLGENLYLWLDNPTSKAMRELTIKNK